MSQKNNNINKTDEKPKTENSKVSKVQKENEIIEELRKKRIQSMTNEEIIEENLKAILDKKSQDERKANGRLIAVLVAFLLIFLAIYHAWIRKTAVLAGVLVPAAIMLGYGGWVVVLARRDKRKRELFEKHVEEVALKNKFELEKVAQSKNSKAGDEEPTSTTTTFTTTKTKLHFENETSNKNKNKNKNKTVRSGSSTKTVTVEIEDHRKQRKRRDKKTALAPKVNKDGHVKRPSLREKLFRQTPNENSKTNTKLETSKILVHEKRKKLKRTDTLAIPQVIRMSSAP